LATAPSVPGAGVGAPTTALSSEPTGREEVGNKESTPIKEPSPDPVLGVVESASAKDAEVPAPSPPPATEGTAKVQVGDVNVEAHRVVSPQEPTAVEPNAEPAQDEATRVVPPEMSDEVPDGLINDDLLEGGLM